MPYYRFDNGLQPLSAPPEDWQGVLAVLEPSELHSAPLPPWLTPPAAPADPHESQFCWLRIDRDGVTGHLRTPVRASQSARHMGFTWTRDCLLLSDPDHAAADCIAHLTTQRTQPPGSPDAFVVALLIALIRDDLPYIQQLETRNNVEALFFTDKQQVYKVRLAELEDGKVAQMGIFIPGRLGMDEGENVLSMVITGDYSGFMLFFFASGKCAKIPLSSYATKQNRRKLLKAYSDKEPLAMMLYQPEETELAIRTSASRMLLVGTAQIAAKTTRDSQGVAVVTLKKNQTIASVVPADTLELANPHRYRVRSLPATGALIRAEDEGEQMSLL